MTRLSRSTLYRVYLPGPDPDTCELQGAKVWWTGKALDLPCDGGEMAEVTRHGDGVRFLVRPRHLWGDTP